EQRRLISSPKILISHRGKLVLRTSEIRAQMGEPGRSFLPIQVDRISEHGLGRAIAIFGKEVLALPPRLSDCYRRAIKKACADSDVACFRQLHIGRHEQTDVANAIVWQRRP